MKTLAELMRAEPSAYEIIRALMEERCREQGHVWIRADRRPFCKWCNITPREAKNELQ